jgi:hypothetical protein
MRHVGQHGIARPDIEAIGLKQVRRHRNVVVREVCDAQGKKMALVVEPHDATEAGVIAAAQRATDRMYAEYPEASNIESRIAATDDTGGPKWSISPNFQHLAEIGTAESRYIWGDLAGARNNEPSRYIASPESSTSRARAGAVQTEPPGVRQKSSYSSIEAKKPISG